MKQTFSLVTPDRLQIREGGGCLSLFGIPFLSAGVFLLLALLGIVPVSNADTLPSLTWPFLVLMAVAFIGAGAGLTFGRSWTTIDRSSRHVIKQWGLLIPMRQRSSPLGNYPAVILRFVEGDSDTADRFPVGLKAGAGADLPLSTFPAYAQAREFAKAVAMHLLVDVEDASTDHPIRLPVDQLNVSYQDRQRQQNRPDAVPVRPADARADVIREVDGIKIVIPLRPMPALMLAAGLIPVAIAFGIGPSLVTFLRETRTPAPVGWVFLGFLTLFFGVLPLTMVVNAFVRSRRGATTVAVSRSGLSVYQRGAWRTRTIAVVDAADVFDVDYSSRESTLASARRDAEQQVLQAHPSASLAVSPRVDRMLARLARFGTSKGVTVKTRTGLISFAQGLDEAEIRYLHEEVRRALLG